MHASPEGSSTSSSLAQVLIQEGTLDASLQRVADLAVTEVDDRDFFSKSAGAFEDRELPLLLAALLFDCDRRTLPSGASGKSGLVGDLEAIGPPPYGRMLDYETALSSEDDVGPYDHSSRCTCSARSWTPRCVEHRWRYS